MTPAEKKAQFMASLERANRIRLARAELKRQIRDRKLSILDAIERPCCATATLYSLLISQRTWGERKTAKFFSDLANVWYVPIGLNRRCMDLTERQKATLRTALEGR